DPNAGDDDQYRHVIALAKNNLADAPALAYSTRRSPSGVITIDWHGPLDVKADDLASSTDDDRTALDEAMYVIHSILLNGPVPASEVRAIAAKAGVATRTLMRGKDKLSVRSKRRGSGRRSEWIWLPPENEQLVR